MNEINLMLVYAQNHRDAVTKIDNEVEQMIIRSGGDCDVLRQLWLSDCKREEDLSHTLWKSKCDFFTKK